MRDVVTGIALAALMVVLLIDARSIPGPQFEPLGPRYMAVAVPGLILVLSLLLILRGVMASARDGSFALSIAFGPEHKVALGVFAVLFAYAAMLEMRLGFGSYVAVSGVFFLAMGLLCGGRPTLRSLGAGAVVGFGLSFAIAYLFTELLYVTLPS